MIFKFVKTILWSEKFNPLCPSTKLNKLMLLCVHEHSENIDNLSKWKNVINSKQWTKLPPKKKKKDIIILVSI
jgi:hypothetical protein